MGWEARQELGSNLVPTISYLCDLGHVPFIFLAVLGMEASACICKPLSLALLNSVSKKGLCEQGTPMPQEVPAAGPLYPLRPGPLTLPSCLQAAAAAVCVCSCGVHALCTCVGAAHGYVVCISMYACVCHTWGYV